MPRRPVVLIHGYSDRGESFLRWRDALVTAGYDAHDIPVCSYQTLTNEISVKDIAEGFDRALRERAGLSASEPFDAIVHSTGMLVIRDWLTTYDERRERLRHLVALAPATFGSPIAHKGRSWLGALFKGRHELGPDFLEAGDGVLDALELGSRFTWDLAHLDLLGDRATYGPTRSTPFAFVLIGTQGYTGLKKLIGEPGSDGVVRWAGCSLNTRKIIIDLTRDRARPRGEDRTSIADWSNVDVPMIPLAGLDHGSILSSPSEQAVELVLAALDVNSAADFDAWQKRAARETADARKSLDEWQQFVVRCVDERGDPVPDYFLQLMTADGDRLEPFDADVHAYSADTSLRCFHVNLSRLPEGRRRTLQIRVIASSGTDMVGYHGVGSEKFPVGDAPPDRNGKWDACLSFSNVIGDEAVKFFYPFTTTLLELRLNREPLPLSGANRIAGFLAE
jgi:pimeloyl-ACP methyl ester carboxylesterase